MQDKLLRKSTCGLEPDLLLEMQGLKGVCCLPPSKAHIAGCQGVVPVVGLLGWLP